MDGISSSDLNHVLAHTEPLWQGLRGRKVFITGGTGFFGCWLLASFAWANRELGLDAQASVLTRSAAQFRKKAPEIAAQACLRLVEGDVRSFAFPDGEYTHVIHAATESATNLNATDPLEMLDTILDGTRQVLRFARQNPVEKMLYVSSGAVYGRQPPELRRVPETYLGGPDPLRPFSAYAEGKRAAELLCALHPELNALVARCFAFVGPFLSLDAHFAIGDFILDGLRGRDITVNGDGTPYRSYLYAADLAIWLWTLLLAGKPGEAYNVGSAEDLPIVEVARRVAGHFQPAPQVRVMKNPEPGKPAERYVPDVSKAERDLGLKVSVGLDEAIEKTIAWNTGRGIRNDRS